MTKKYSISFRVGDWATDQPDREPKPTCYYRGPLAMCCNSCSPIHGETCAIQAISACNHRQPVATVAV